MMFIDDILTWARGKGYDATYGSPSQVNEALNNIQYSHSQDEVVVFSHLITDSETVDGKDTATVAIYFSKLCDFDFDGEQLLPEQESLKNIGKQLLHDLHNGAFRYSNVRWQYGYDDYAENVMWVCLRVKLESLKFDCVPLELPTTPKWIEIEYPYAIDGDYLPWTGNPFYVSRTVHFAIIYDGDENDVYHASADITTYGQVTVDTYDTYTLHVNTMATMYNTLIDDDFLSNLPEGFAEYYEQYRGKRFVNYLLSNVQCPLLSSIRVTLDFSLDGITKRYENIAKQ